jgi:hypothetical protein
MDHKSPTESVDDLRDTFLAFAFPAFWPIAWVTSAAMERWPPKGLHLRERGNGAGLVCSCWLWWPMDGACMRHCQLQRCPLLPRSPCACWQHAPNCIQACPAIELRFYWRVPIDNALGCSVPVGTNGPGTCPLNSNCNKYSIHLAPFRFKTYGAGFPGGLRSKNQIADLVNFQSHLTAGEVLHTSRLSV